MGEQYLPFVLDQDWRVILRIADRGKFHPLILGFTFSGRKVDRFARLALCRIVPWRAVGLFGSTVSWHSAAGLTIRRSDVDLISRRILPQCFSGRPRNKRRFEPRRVLCLHRLKPLIWAE